MTNYGNLMDLFHPGRNPYAGFPAAQWGGTWYNDGGARREIFGKCINLLQPAVIVEVGSFVGESAIHMAKLIKASGRDTAILCIDTWCGGFDHWKGAREKIINHFGRPDFFYKFMANVITNDCQDVIVPLATDSLNGARLLKHFQIAPGLVYIDGSHEQGDVLRDYEAYWPVVGRGGGMLVDDLTGWFPGVLHDWDVFVKTHNLTVNMQEGEKALVRKP